MEVHSRAPPHVGLLCTPLIEGGTFLCPWYARVLLSAAQIRFEQQGMAGKPVLRLLRLHGAWSIFEQLCVEEALLRSSAHNWYVPPVDRPEVRAFDVHALARL